MPRGRFLRLRGRLSRLVFIRAGKSFGTRCGGALNASADGCPGRGRLPASREDAKPALRRAHCRPPGEKPFEVNLSEKRTMSLLIDGPGIAI